MCLQSKIIMIIIIIIIITTIIMITNKWNKLYIF